MKESPTIQDPRELQTIMISSIRALFGDLEHYSYDLEIKKAAPEDDFSFVVECPSDSVGAVRSALSMVTPPPYLDSNIYRFDVLGLTEVRK